MGEVLLRNLGVDETIVKAIDKSCAGNWNSLQIVQQNNDLKLFIKCAEKCRPRHVMTISHFFGEKTFPETPKTETELVPERYKCQDRVEFFSDDGTGESNIKINGQKLKISGAMYKLFLHLAQELKKGEGGWAYVSDMVEGKVINSYGHQPFSRLRSILAGYLMDNNPKDFIECNGRKQFRIATNPDNIILFDGDKK